MAAIRLGSALSNITGSANQKLRVNTGETGFEFFSPATIPAYTNTNVTTDRVLNANDVTTDKLADVLGTLIADVSAMLSQSGGVPAFQFSSTEQVYPFEKHSNGSTLYCKEVNFGNLPNNGWKAVAHGISNFNAGDDVFSLNINRKIDTNTYAQVPAPDPNQTYYQVGADVYQNNIEIGTGWDQSSHTAIVRLIYKKSG